ncbi:MAG TPA: PilZ domain-containing protein [Candidatus Acidoferrales bacterium]|nr:PilZ domain-containing protein [Candidatus Acidoferrales bacterium]
MFDVAPITSTAAARKRRSTRLEHSVPVTVTGVDAGRGPYQEEVSTVNISCHGCRYNSRFHVLIGALVTLQVSRPEPGQPSITARARVRWVERPEYPHDHFQVAVEMENPGNIWGLEMAPPDWITFPERKAADAAPPSTKPFAVPKPAPPPPDVEREIALPRTANAPVPPAARPVLGDFSEQLEAMVTKAASSAAAEQARLLFADLRAQLVEEARKTFEVMAAKRADKFAQQMLDQVKTVQQSLGKELHEEWTRKLKLDYQQASERLASQGAELSERASSLTATAVDRMERNLEASRRDWADKLVARVQQQLSPLIGQAQEVSKTLAAHHQEAERASGVHRDALERSLQESFIQTTSGMAETSSLMEKKFEEAVTRRLREALVELEKKSSAATQSCYENLRRAAEGYAEKTQGSLHAVLQQLLEESTRGLETRAAEVSREFAGEIDSFGRSYLEGIGQLMSELPKKLGNRPVPGGSSSK